MYVYVMIHMIKSEIMQKKINLFDIVDRLIIVIKNVAKLFK